MSDNHLKKTLEQAFPETPALFHERMLSVAEGARQSRKVGRRHLIVRVALICVLLLTFSGAAVAAMTHYGVLNFDPGMGDDYYFTLPEAQNMIRYDLADVRTGNLRWRIKEAIYDGRVMRVLYSVQDLLEKEPFPALPEQDMPGFAAEYYHAIAEREHVYLKADGNGEIIINDLGVNLESVNYRPGQELGEIEFWMDCRMEYYNMETGQMESIQPEGVISVSLPFSFHDGFSQENAPEAIAFQMDVGDAASRYALVLPGPITLDNGTVVEISDLHFSPATVFISYTLTVPAERVPEGLNISKWDNVEAYYDLAEQMEEYKAAWNTHLENEQGEELGFSKDGSYGDDLNADGTFTIRRHYECTPSDRYTKTIYLCIGPWKIPLSMTYQVNE